MDNKERIKEIGEMVKKARTSLNITQAELGAACGYSRKVSEAFIWQWETGRRAIPSTKYRTVASMLNLDINDLVL